MSFHLFSTHIHTELEHCSPLLVCKHELAKLQVPQHDAVLVAVSHCRGYLIKKLRGLLFRQTLAALHESVHVAVVLLLEHIGLAFPEDNVFDLGDIPVSWQHAVSPDLLLVLAHVKHLQDTEYFQNLVLFCSVL